MRKDGHGLAELVCRQVLAVRARVRRELLLVELLRRVEDELRRVAEALAREHLQCRERERQRLRLLLLRFLIGGDDGIVRHLLEEGELLVSNLLVDQAVLAVEPGHRVLGLPLRLEDAVHMLEDAADQVVRDGLEVLDLALAAHDERECRRLDTANRQHEPLVASAPRGQSIGTREVHADEPVGPRTRERRLLEVEEIAVVAQARIGLLDALLVECIQENAAHGLLVPEVVEHLVDEQLSLAVRVAAVHDLVGLLDQRLDDGELLLAVLIDEELPMLGDDGQVLRAPALVLRVVLLWLRLTQDVAKEPGHDAVLRHEVAIAPRDGARQAFGELTPHTRFLGNIQTQESCGLLSRIKTSRDELVDAPDDNSDPGQQEERHEDTGELGMPEDVVGLPLAVRPHAVRQQPHERGNGCRHDHDIVDHAEHGDGIGNEVNRAQEVEDGQEHHALDLPRGLAALEREQHDEDVMAEKAQYAE